MNMKIKGKYLAIKRDLLMINNKYVEMIEGKI